MLIAIPKETREGETRVAATPDIIKKYIQLGFDVHVQSEAGLASGFSDKAYQDAGAKITPDIACNECDNVAP